MGSLLILIANSVVTELEGSVGGGDIDCCKQASCHYVVSLSLSLSLSLFVRTCAVLEWVGTTRKKKKGSSESCGACDAG